MSNFFRSSSFFLSQIGHFFTSLLFCLSSLLTPASKFCLLLQHICQSQPPLKSKSQSQSRRLRGWRSEGKMFKFLKGVVAGSGTGVKDLPYNIGEPYSSAWGSWTHSHGTSKVFLILSLTFVFLSFILLYFLNWNPLILVLDRIFLCSN